MFGNGAQTAAAESPMNKALGGVHAELVHLEDMAYALEQRLIPVLEDSNQIGAAQKDPGVASPAPTPVHVVSMLSTVEVRVSNVRSRLSNLLDRLHI